MIGTLTSLAAEGAAIAAKLTEIQMSLGFIGGVLIAIAVIMELRKW